MQQIPKQYLLVGGVIIILIGVIAYFLLSSNSGSTADKKDTVFEEPTEVIPTVDSSVKVSITGNKEAVIKIDGIPANTSEVEYELSYNTATGSVEGVFGTIKVKGNSAEEKITFGTCSSGVCRYHDIKGKVKGTFRFTGSYGKRLLEKEFSL